MVVVGSAFSSSSSVRQLLKTVSIYFSIVFLYFWTLHVYGHLNYMFQEKRLSPWLQDRPRPVSCSQLYFFISRLYFYISQLYFCIFQLYFSEKYSEWLQDRPPPVVSCGAALAVPPRPAAVQCSAAQAGSSTSGCCTSPALLQFGEDAWGGVACIWWPWGWRCCSSL